MEILKYLEAIKNELVKNQSKLNELDAAIGDNDHGTNICHGFVEICEKGKEKITKNSKLSDDLKFCGLTIMSKVGGSSGAILGNALMKMSQAVEQKDKYVNSDIAKMLQTAVAGVQNIGKAVPGEKTLLDALYPAAQAFANTKDDQPLAFEQAATAAAKGAEDTIPMVATKGRASYLWERSKDHMDPGAMSISIIFGQLRGIK